MSSPWLDHSGASLQCFCASVGWCCSDAAVALFQVVLITGPALFFRFPCSPRTQVVTNDFHSIHHESPNAPTTSKLGNASGTRACGTNAPPFGTTLSRYYVYPVSCILYLDRQPIFFRFGSPLAIPSCLISVFSRFPFATAESIEELQQRRRIISAQHQATPVREPPGSQTRVSSLPLPCLGFSLASKPLART